MCRKVWSKHALAGLTYSLRYTGGKFDLSNAALLHGPDEHGFSCATFVLAVFESGTVTILDWRRWRRRGEDRDWQENIADTLQRSDTSPEYQALLHRELGSLRFRPEEVAAGAAAKRFPAGFRFVERAALQLLVKLGVSGVAEQLEQLERDAGWLTRLSWLRGR